MLICLDSFKINFSSMYFFFSDHDLHELILIHIYLKPSIKIVIPTESTPPDIDTTILLLLLRLINNISFLNLKKVGLF